MLITSRFIFTSEVDSLALQLFCNVVVRGPRAHQKDATAHQKRQNAWPRPYLGVVGLANKLQQEDYPGRIYSDLKAVFISWAHVDHLKYFY